MAFDYGPELIEGYVAGYLEHLVQRVEFEETVVSLQVGPGQWADVAIR
jgi:hypothetical protein